MKPEKINKTFAESFANKGLSEEYFKNLIEKMPLGVVIHSLGKIVYVNNFANAIMEVELPGTLVGTDVINYVHPDFREQALKRITESLKQKTKAEPFEEMLITCKGKSIYVEVEALPIEYNNQPAMLTVIMDVTSRKLVEQDLKAAKNKLEVIFDNGPDAILVTRAHDGLYVDSNKTFTRYTGYTPEEMAGKTTIDLDIWDDPKDREKLVKDLKEKGYCHNLELNVKNKNGTKRVIDMSAEIIMLNGIPHLVSISRDIFGRKEIEYKLKQSEEKYRLLIETASDVIYTVGVDGTITSLNPAFEILTGFKISESLGRFFGDFIHPDDLNYALEIHQMIQADINPPIFELRFLFSDGTYQFVEFSVSPLHHNGKVSGTLGIGRIVQERKDAEKRLVESEEKFRILIEQAADGIFVGDRMGNFIEVNTRGCEFTGYTRAELLKMNMKDLYSPEELEKYPLRYDLLLKGESVKNERMLTRKDGKVIPVEMNTRRISNGTYQAIIRDISERRKAEEFMLKYQEELEKLVKKRTRDLEKINHQLKKEIKVRVQSEAVVKTQLKEKEILLKEIHHRVKNNMQVIISLLNLHAATIEDPRILDLYKESQNRIKSMALIHEKLYQSKDFTHIDFSDYLSSLASYLTQIYQISTSVIQVVTKAEQIPIEFDTAITLGLIVNELVTNSMKYAFHGSSKGKISIELKKSSPETICLVVADNGCGIPKGVNYRNTKSLGLQLVCTLTEQLNGKITLAVKNGTRFKLEFPINQMR